MAMEQKHK